MPGVTWSGLSRPTYNLIGKTSTGIKCFVVRDVTDNTWAVVVNKLPLKTGVRNRDAARRICERVVAEYGLSQSNPRRKAKRRNPSIDRAVQLAIQDATKILGHRPRMGRSRV